MAITPWQSVPGTAASLLKGWPHGDVRDKLQSTLEPAMDSGIASATAKISHKVLPPHPSADSKF